jgi:hypothetical protein
MGHDATFRWETLPEYIATQQYSRCLGRICASLPWWVRRRSMGPMTRAAIGIATGIVGFNADLPPDERLTRAEREAFRRFALAALDESRAGLAELARVRKVSRPDLTAALELLERIEAGVRAADPPPDWL